ncbi:GTPase [Caulobacter sp. CCNWLY153]|uniref:GTPase family protein n=1 Tax=unclassified Caulobacter TaxID=2648921 RepID=UPI002FF3D627
MIDGATIAGYGIMGGGSGLASGLVSRIMQHIFPTPLEKAQLHSLYENLDLARQRLEREEDRVREEWNLRRDLQLKQIEAGHTLEQDRDLMRRWPLEVPAPAFLRYSQGRTGAALNVVLWPEQRRTPHLEAARANGLLQNFHTAADALLDSAARMFGQDVIFYRETEKPSGVARPTLSGQQLEATLYSLTATEPTVLLQVAVEGPQALRLNYSCWAWAGDKQEPLSGSIVVEGAAPMSAKDIERALLAVICALSDQYQLVRTLKDPKAPRFLQLLGVDCGLRVRDDRSAGEAMSIEELLGRNYRSALDDVAGSQPTLAAEAAARAALAAKGRGLHDLAETFLGTSLDHYRAGQPGGHDMGRVVALLMRPSSRDPEPLVRNALREIRNLDPMDFREKGGKMTLEDVLASFGEYDKQLSPEAREKLRAKITELMTYRPKVGIFGKAGVGKSSLSNALFGKDAFEVSDVSACTRAPQEELLKLEGDHGMTILDVPGVGESAARDKEYGALYRNLLPELDALIWVLKGDDRAFSTDHAFYTDVVKPHIDLGKPFLIALNQVDKIMPFREWQDELRQPGPTQAANIELKRDDVASIFDLDRSQVIPVSAQEKYGLSTLIDKLLLSLPDSKRAATFIALPAEHISKAAKEAVGESIANEVSGALVGAGVVTGALIGTILFPIVGTIIGGAIGGFLGSLWRS